MTVSEAAKTLGVSVREVYDLVDRRELPAELGPGRLAPEKRELLIDAGAVQALAEGRR